VISPTRCCLAGTGIVCLILPPPAGAPINPDYTPVDLVRQSEVILRLELTAPGPDGKLGVKLVEAVQGKAPAKLVLEWRLPGGRPQTKRVIVLKPTRFVQPAAGK